MSYLPHLLKRVWLAPFILLFCAMVVCAQAPNTSHSQRVLIDRSGSMQGFFATRKVDEMQQILRDLSGPASDTYYFVDKALVPQGQETAAFGNNTYLSNALELTIAQQAAPAILWLVTDNQPSVGNQSDSDKDIAAFYNRLRSDTIKRIYFFPLKLDFQGKLFREDDSVLAANYVGKRGLLVYALLLNEAARDEFERATAEFQKRYRAAGETRRILIKPLEQDTITAELVEGDKFRVEKDEVIGNFDEGARISGHFKIRLSSKLGQMKIRRGDVKAEPLEFHTGDFTESKLVPTLDPDFVEDLQPSNEPQQEHIIKVKFDAEGVHIRNSLVSWWNCITHNRGDISGHIKMTINVPGENFDVVNSLMSEFSTTRDIYNDAGENVQSRIYKLDDLVKKMLPEREVDIHPRIGANESGTIPMHLIVRYPKWPVVVLMVAIVVLLLLLLLLWRLLRRPQLYRLTWDSGRYRACPDFRLWPLIGRRVDLDDRAAATIKKGLGGIQVSAASGYTVDDTRNRFVNATGTDFNITQADTGAGINFYFSSSSAAFRAGTTHQEDDGILGGISYSGTGEDGAGGLSGLASAPPIRKPTTGRSGNNGSAAENKTDDDSSYNLDDLFP